MAASSSATSSIQKRFKYEVFLSFRGADTRNNFVGHLYNALQQKSIETYKDDEKIKKGENISNELITSIENSKFYIIVFSKNYASSPWCLNELVKIMECQRTADHTAYPLFYDVEPSEVRKQSGAVKEAFVKNEKKEAAGKWREALREAADLAGWELKNTANGDEAKLIKKIVEELSLALRCIRFNIDEDLVGMESRMKEVLSSFGTDSNDVRMIGIKGMGGGGKTTLARAVYDHISYEFEGKSFVENVREVSKASLSGLKSLQCQLLSDVFNDESIHVSSVSDGKHMMKRRMCDKKVLVVLDDVDHIDQLQALAGEPNWFKIGSRIIITTRDEQVLVAHGVKFGVKFSHDVNLLSDKEATFLFCKYAFGRDIPTQGYEELSKQVVRYADGLPLTIKVLGSDLCGQNVFHWKDVLKRLEKIPLQETQKKLEISYMGLEEDHKEIFLDVACLFNHMWIDHVIKALESCGFHSRSALRVLEKKSLITLYNGYVRMHDHIAEMGRNIVRRSHPPHEHSRLWDRGEIEDIFANDSGTEATRCIELYTQNFSPCMVVNGLRKMKQLRFLSIHFFPQNSEIDIAASDFPNALQYLEWIHYPFRSLPTTFQANNLVTLTIRGSSIVQLWEGEDRKVLSNLKNLDLSSRLMSTLDLRLLAPNLDMLELLDCTNLVELHMPVDCLNLTTIKISRSLLRTLDLGQTPNIEVLDLTECNYLEELHMNGECQNLYILKITRSKLRSLDIGLTPNLEQLTLTKSYELEDLQMSDGCQKLIDIDISRSKLRTFDLGKIPNVKMLDLTGCKYLEELQIPNGCPKSLVTLELAGSLRFTSFIFHNDGNTYCSENASESHEALEIGPLALLHLIAESLESCRQHPGNNLPKFHFNCLYIEDRPSSTRNLEILLSLGMCACTDLETFSRSICRLQRLGNLKLGGSILEAPLDLGQLKCLEKLILSSTKINHLPDSICMLKNLKSLKLNDCWLLEELPEDIGQLECLEELIISSTVIKHLPDSICMLKRLQSLQLIFCWLLEKLPEDVGGLKCLEKLTLSSAKIKHLPDSICMLKHLKSLKLNPCMLLEELPEDLGRLERLEELILSSTVIKHLPDSICMLKHLKNLELHECSLLEKLRGDLGRLERLEELILRQCETLEGIPNSICEMKCLNRIHLQHCIRVEKLPEELGCLERLKSLDIQGTSISHLPQSILLSKGLLISGSRGLLESYGFTCRINTFRMRFYVVVE